MKSEELYTLQEVAEILRSSVKTVRRRIASGVLPAIKEGGRRLIWSDDLEAYLAAKTEKARRR